MSNVYKAKCIKNWDVDVCDNGMIKPARPLNSKFITLRQRINSAWLVLIGTYDALDWEDHE